MQVLELYSGIGGMHLALLESGKQGTIKVAIEINPTANSIYKHNFKETKLLNYNIEGLTLEAINKFKIDTIFMSPPCQPFTRNGKVADIKDARTDSFSHILDLLPNLDIQNLLIENVKGFETSQMRDILIKTLKANNFKYQEFLLSPKQFGVPNSRLRYYCLAKKGPASFTFETQENVIEILPNTENQLTCFEIQDILDEELNEAKYLLSDSILKKRLGVLDICCKHSRRSCCFTKAYGRFIEGTGSVLSDQTDEFVRTTLAQTSKMDSNSKEYLQAAKALNLRFFAPKEISRLMSFPETFSFPQDVTDRQKYMVLGNSVNVRVVSELIKLL